MVARLSLYKNKLNSHNLVQYIVTTITSRLGLVMCQWLAVQLDRALTNRNGITKTNVQYAQVKLATNYCSSHGLNNVGKRFSDATKHA